MTIPERIHELIERFDRNIDVYKSGHYNETEVRHEFRYKLTACEDIDQ